jgi:SPP1 family phage portal protein
MFFTETERIVADIESKANSIMTTEEILLSEILDWQINPKRQQMLVGQRYYENRNDILQRRRMVIGEGGSLWEDPNLANTRISHAFAKKLVDQKCQYLLGNPLAISSDCEELNSLMNEIFDKQMLRRLGNVCKECINKGIAWLQIYINSDGKLDFMKIPAEEVIPLWQDGEKRFLQGIIRVYTVLEYVGKEPTKAVKVEYWTDEGVRYYRMEKDDSRKNKPNYSLVPDEDIKQKFKDLKLKKDEPFPHFIHGRKFGCWEKVPFVAFRYNEEELPLISFIKGLIDDYDILKSDDTNTILDNPNSLLVIRNYDGTDLGEFRRNLAAYRAVKVSDNGGLESICADINTTSINEHLNMVRKDLFEMGGGVDTQNNHTGNTSGEYLKYLYADLDLDCNGIEREFQSSLEQLLYFICRYYKLLTEVDYSKEKVNFLFNRDIIINETEAINNCLNSMKILSEKTVLANHPWVTDPINEQKMIAEEADSSEHSNAENSNIENDGTRNDQEVSNEDIVDET